MLAQSCLQDKYVTTKAYQSDIVIESLKIGFGALDSIHLAKLYSCPNPNFDKEREIPPQMVALAATTVCLLIILNIVLILLKDYATLQHLLYDGSGSVTDFSTPTLHSVYQAHMVRLVEWRRRLPRIHHKYMHQQYKVVM